jgi:hypothetical protein
MTELIWILHSCRRSLDGPGRDADNGRAGRHITSHNCVRADFQVIADLDRTNEARTYTYVDMPTNRWDAGMGITDSHLLKQQAIRTNLDVRVDYNSIRMGDQQTAPSLQLKGISAPVTIDQKR